MYIPLHSKASDFSKLEACFSTKLQCYDADLAFQRNKYLNVHIVAFFSKIGQSAYMLVRCSVYPNAAFSPHIESGVAKNLRELNTSKQTNNYAEVW